MFGNFNILLLLSRKLELRMKFTNFATIKSSLEVKTLPTLPYAFSFSGCIYFLTTTDACIMHVFLEVSDAARGLRECV